jgi:predicted metal-binding membrane protein
MNRRVEAVLRRDRAVVIAAVAILTMLAWADMIWLADDIAMGGMDMTEFWVRHSFCGGGQRPNS